MILVLGGVASGKRTFAEALGVPECDTALDVHERLRECEDVDALLDELSGARVVTCAEVGSGIVPMGADERAYRERVGRFAIALAERADTVVRMVCGIPVVLKGEDPRRYKHADEDGEDVPTAARLIEVQGKMVPAQAARPPHPRRHAAQAAKPPLPDGARMELVMIRHGQTLGNGEKRYVGVIDQPLSDAGRGQARAAGAHDDAKRVYVSPLRRTHETAAIMFPNAEQVVVEGIQEMDFGSFAGRTPDEMENDDAYRAWVDGECRGACPGGESQAGFTDRVCAALVELLRDAGARGETELVMVAHGGTMMAFLDRFGNDPSKKYWEWLVGNCEGYRLGLLIDGPRIVVTSIDHWR